MRTVQSLFRYPVKGLSPEPLNGVQLHTGRGFPLDRNYALTNGGWQFEPAHYQPRPKTDFLMLMQHERLASLNTRVDETQQRITVTSPDGQTKMANLHDSEDLQRLADFITTFVDKPLPGKPQFIQASSTASERFTDVSVVSPTLMNSVSLINLATVRDVERVLSKPVDPLRFRANIYFDGGEAWEELAWVDKEIHIGSINARVVLRTRRCAATNVNPKTGVRDLGIPQALIKNFRHGDVGIYAELLTDGLLSPGDALVPPAA